jgi:glutamyl-tRNA reductase
MVSRALHARFESIRESELARLEKKLRGLTADDRRAVEAITAEVIHAIVRVPQQAIEHDTPPHALEALIELFGLGREPLVTQQ